jgi:hypothetical protein
MFYIYSIEFYLSEKYKYFLYGTFFVLKYLLNYNTFNVHKYNYIPEYS